MPRVTIYTKHFSKPLFPPYSAEEYQTIKAKIIKNPAISLDPEGEQSSFSKEEKGYIRIYLIVLGLSLITLAWTIDIFLTIFTLGALYFLLKMIGSAFRDDGKYIKARNNFFSNLKIIIVKSESYSDFIEAYKAI